jgi:hypothetical protein
MLKTILGLIAGISSIAAFAAEKSSSARSAADPLIGAKLGSKEVTQRFDAA